MGRKKTKLLRDGGEMWAYMEKLQLISRSMHRFPADGLVAGKMPDNVQRALTMFFISLKSPEFLHDSQPIAQQLRLELVGLMREYPEFTVAAIYSFFIRQPKPGISISAAIRDFLPEAFVTLEDGHHVFVSDASDDQIADAIQREYGFKVVKSDHVKRIRHEMAHLSDYSLAELLKLVKKNPVKTSQQE
jgi:hypothetical protein